MPTYQTARQTSLTAYQAIRSGIAVVTSVDANYFSLDGRSYPKAMQVFPSGVSDATLLGSNLHFIVKAGSTVGGSVPGNQTDLLKALENIVTYEYRFRLLPLPHTVTLNDGNPKVVITEGLEFPRAVTLTVVTGDTVQVRYRILETDAWTTLGSYTTSTADVIDLGTQAVEFQRTAGTGTTSTCVID
jgi:hypothetical protein